MAIGLAVVAAAGAIWSGVNSAKQAKEGRKMQNEAKKAMENFQYSNEEFVNAYDDIGISRLGADLQRETNAQSMATSVEALRSGGIRGLVGGLGQLNSQNQYNNALIAADLDQKQNELNQMRAQEDIRIRNMEENRDMQKLAGYGSLYNVGLQMKYDGRAGVANAVQSLGNTATNYYTGGYGSTGFNQGATPSTQVNPYTPYVQNSLQAAGPVTGYTMPTASTYNMNFQ